MQDISAGSVASRLFNLIVSLLALVVVTFVIGRVLPADPVGAIVGEMADPAAYAAMRARLGLDLPFHEQLWVYLGALARGDLGTAILTGNPVVQDLATVFPATLELATLAILISMLVGVPLGMAAAYFRDTAIDQFARVISLVGHSVPVFWLGILGLIIFYGALQLVGGPGRVDVYYEGLVASRTGMLLIDSLLDNQPDIFWNALSHIILPACILAYASMAYLTRMTRSFTLEQLNQDYVIAARAKGASPWRVVARHILPNIAVQLVTILVIAYGGLLEGAVVTEIVFSWPGLGQYMTSALSIGDMNAILASTLVIGVIFMTLNFIADLCYFILDPRTRGAR